MASDHVEAGQWVILSTNGEKRLLKVEGSNKLYIDHDRVPVLGLVGIPFGAVLRIANGAVSMDDRLAEDINGTAQEWERAAAAHDETRTNKELFDDGKAQALSSAEIEELKAQGIQGEDLVRRIADGSATFEAKTAFSQHKYLMKKAKKYTPVVQVFRPTPAEICEVYAAGRLDKIHELRVDSLALLLARSNVRAGARMLVLDTTTGLVIGALAQRLGGHGSLLIAHAKQHVPLDGVHQLNLRDDEWGVLSAAPLDDVRNVLEQTMELPAAAPATEAASAIAAEDVGGGAPATESGGSAPEYARSNGRSYRRFSAEETAAWLAEGCDAVVVAMHASTPELLRTLVRAARPSASIAVYNASLLPLAQFAQECAHARSQLMQAQLCESWAREYQVLPNRTHPMMTNVLPTGFLLSGFARPAADVVAKR
jgi:tRNA (adenine-N(1)-)-methyltransferase non-catalytic subunit